MTTATTTESLGRKRRVATGPTLTGAVGVALLERDTKTTSTTRSRRKLLVLALFTTLITGLLSLVGAGTAAAGTGITRGTLDASGGVYWRSTPDWNNAVRVTGFGFYPNSVLELQCYEPNGTATPYSQNFLWYTATVVGGSGTGTGWVNDHFVNTGINQPNIPVSGVPRCGAGGSGSGAGGGAPTGTYLSRTWQLRYCTVASVAGCNPSTAAANRAPSIAANTPVTMVCFEDGMNATGDYTTNRFFWVRAANDVQGFVSASVVRNQTGVPNCSTSVNVRVAEAAATRSGQVMASAADAQLFTVAEWGSPYGEWAGDCPKLPYAAWYTMTGTKPLRYDAITNYRMYQQQGRIRSGTPSVGMIVYFDVTSYGHTAVYLGGGMVATTTGMDGNRTANTILPMSSYGNTYLGWVRP